MAPGSQPCDQLHEIWLCHRRTARGRPINAAPNMKKNRAACAGYWRIGVVSDLDEPMIRKITRAHFFVRVIVRRILGINYNMAIVIRRPRVIAPHVCFGYLVIRVVGSRRQVRFVSENFADLEYSGRRPPVSLFFSKARLVLPGEPCPPSDSIFAKQHGKRSSTRRPIP